MTCRGPRAAWSTRPRSATAAAAQLLALGGVQAGGRFVEEEQTRSTGQGAGQADQLALALRQLVGRAVHQVAEVQSVDGGVSGHAGGIAARLGRTRSRRGCHHAVGSAATRRLPRTSRSSKSSTCLERAHQAEARPVVGGQAVEVATVEGDRASVRCEAGQRVDARRLAGAVGTDEPDQGSPLPPRSTGRRGPAPRRSGRSTPSPRAGSLAELAVGDERLLEQGQEAHPTRELDARDRPRTRTVPCTGGSPPGSGGVPDVMSTSTRGMTATGPTGGAWRVGSRATR